MKILLAVDGSTFTKHMLAWLATHDEWLQPAHEFTILTVTAPIPPHAASMFPAEELKAYYQESSDKVFTPIRKFMAKHDMAVSYASKVGHAPQEIAKFADKGKFDLLVMGSHGHGNFMSMVMGSVANQVLARSKVPVLLVR
jgi:nucleotide-binding universal stress UspA family protein